MAKKAKVIKFPKLVSESHQYTLDLKPVKTIKRAFKAASNLIKQLEKAENVKASPNAFFFRRDGSKWKLDVEVTGVKEYGRF